MKDVINTAQRIMHAVVLAYIANVKLDLVVVKRDAHVFLLFFIAAEDADFRKV